MKNNTIRIIPQNEFRFVVMIDNKMTVVVDRETMQVVEDVNSNNAYNIIEQINRIAKIGIKCDFMNKFGMINKKIIRL